jgi:hypothetical protein
MKARNTRKETDEISRLAIEGEVPPDCGPASRDVRSMLTDLRPPVMVLADAPAAGSPGKKGFGRSQMTDPGVITKEP